MTQHIGLGSSISQNAFVWKRVPSPSFWSILTPVLSSLIYILYEKFQVLYVLQLVNGFKKYASTLPQVCSRYTVEMAASNMHWYLEGCLWWKQYFFCRYHSHLLCQHIQAAYALRMQLFYMYIFSYIVQTVMEWVACKSPMPLQAQVLYIFSCICNGILPGFNAVTVVCLNIGWSQELANSKGTSTTPLLQKRFFLHIPW